MNHKTRSLIHALAYQAAAGIHTYGQCTADGCKKTARGGAHCSSCVEKALGARIGKMAAKDLRNLYIQREHTQHDIDELIGEIP